MGPKSCRGRRARSRLREYRPRRQTVGPDGYAEGVEGAVGELQDPAGDEGCGGDQQECYGEE